MRMQFGLGAASRRAAALRWLALLSKGALIPALDRLCCWRARSPFSCFARFLPSFACRVSLFMRFISSLMYRAGQAISWRFSYETVQKVPKRQRFFLSFYVRRAVHLYSTFSFCFRLWFRSHFRTAVANRLGTCVRALTLTSVVSLSVHCSAQNQRRCQHCVFSCDAVTVTSCFVLGSSAVLLGW